MQRPGMQRQRIGPAIRRMRRINGMTLDDLASQAGISASHLSRLERGQTLPSFQVLSELAHVLGADVDEFVRLESEVTTLDADFQEILEARGFPDDLQQELMGVSIELRQALFDVFRSLNSPPRKPRRSSRAWRIPPGGEQDAEQTSESES